MLLVILSAITLQTTAPTVVAPSNVKAPPAKTDTAKVATQDDPNKLVCRRQTPTGSYIERRICRTQAAWDGEEAGAASFIASYQAHNAVTPETIRKAP